MTITAQHRPTQQIQREIDQLRRSIQMTDPLPDLSPLEKRVGSLTTQTLLDSKHKPDLHEASVALDQAKAVWQKRASDNSDLRKLEIELDLAQQHYRAEAINAANARLHQARTEYEHAALVCARAFRKYIDTAKHSASIPGASAMINQREYTLHLPTLFPQSWQGSLGESMRSNLMPWEQDEHPSMKRAA